MPNWSELSASERAERAAEIDRQRDLKMQIKLARVTKENDRRKSDSSAIKEDSLLFDGFAAINDIEREIREIELMPASIPSEQESKARLLADAMQRHHHAKRQQDELQKDMLRQHWCELAEMPSLSVLHWIELTKIAVGNINSCWEVKSSGVFPVTHSEDDIALLRDDIDSQRTLLEYQQRQPLLFPCSPKQLIQFIDSDLAGDFAVPKEFRDAVVRSHECFAKSLDAQQIQQSIERKEARIPAPLFGEGFSAEALKITTLTKWLEFETWPAMWAALLVCGIQPPDLSEFDALPENGAFGLDNSIHMGNEDCFHEAGRILTLWKCTADAPAMVRPADFVAWCETKGINTDWLSALSEGSPAIAAPTGAPVKVKPTGNESGTKSVTTHKIETRTNALTAVISKAIESALCPNDVHSIWAAFVAMAEAQNRPFPLLGYVETEGVKYQDESGVAFITKENFLRRVRRRLASKNH